MNNDISTQPIQTYNKSGEPLPDVGLKWGKTPRNADAASKDESFTANSENKEQPDWENFYSGEEKQKLRAKGINPALKAEMEASKRSSKEKGFWGKVAQTAAGGSWIR